MRWLIILLAVVVLSACGSLQVQVDVIDPAYVAEQADQPILRSALQVVLQQTDAETKEVFEKQKELFKKIYLTTAKGYRERAKSEPEARANLIGAAQSLEKTAIEEVSKLYDQPVKELIEINQIIRKKFKDMPQEKQVDILGGISRIEGELAGALRERRLRLVAFSKKVTNEIGEAKGKMLEREFNGTPVVAPNAINEAADQAQTSSNTELRSLNGGQNLTEDPFAFAIASAPDAVWQKKYNRAIASGYLGNVDIAIKLVALGDFTIKGVSFDPSTVAQVASKVTTQALLIATQLAGVPVSRVQSGGGGTADSLAVSTKELADRQRKIARLEAKMEDYRTTLLEIASSITRERATLVADDSPANDQARKSAIDAILVTFEQHKARLDLSGLSEN